MLHHAIVYPLPPRAHHYRKPSHCLLLPSGNSSLRCTCPPPHLPSTSPVVTTYSSPRPPTTSSSLRTLRKASTKPFNITYELAPVPVLSFSGDKVGETYLDLKSTPLDTARSIVHHAIIIKKENKRWGTTSMLTRGEVRGGGVKPFPHKKTCKARRGFQRTSLRPDGEVVFGPKPKDWSIKINRKEKRLALSTTLVSAAAGSTIVVEYFGNKFEKPRMKAFIEAMERWGLDPK